MLPKIKTTSTGRTIWRETGVFRFEFEVGFSVGVASVDFDCSVFLCELELRKTGEFVMGAV